MFEAPALQEKLNAARALEGLIFEQREAMDRDRMYPPSVLDALGDLGIFRALVPADAGGGEWEHPTWMRVVETLARCDGAVGWNSGVGASATALLTGWLPTAIAREISFADRNGVLAGSGAPAGVARPVDGGYVLSGHWQFASGIAHATWVLAGFILEGEDPRIGRIAWLPVNDVEIVDTWFVGGMRGTSSQDFIVKDLFVPSQFVADFVEETSPHGGPLYRFPAVYMLASSLGPIALGLARGALDEFTTLMGTKVDRFSGTQICDRITIQERVARAEALVRSGRSFLYETIDSNWEVVCGGGSLDDQQISLTHLAVMHAIDSSAKAIDLVYGAAGTSSIFTSNPLERFFRDVHVLTQHRFASPQEMYKAGAVLLGAGEGRSFWNPGG